MSRQVSSEMRAVALILTILVSLSACGQSWEIAGCIDTDSLDRAYGDLITSVQTGNYPDPAQLPDEVVVLEQEHRVLEEDRREWAVEQGYTIGTSHGPEFYDEFLVATHTSRLFEYYRYGIGGGAEDGYFRGEGPGKRLYKTGILRGYQVYDGLRHQLLMYNKYRRLSDRGFERITLVVSYPKLLVRLGCPS